MLQVIVSPAKQMREATDAFAARQTPPFPRKTAAIHRELLRIRQTNGEAALKKLWGVSDALLAEALDMLDRFSPPTSQDQPEKTASETLPSPALFSYIGIQYRSMAPDVLDETALEWLDNHLWIVSGLYGCVRPFDAVRPYRLEMGAKLPLGSARNLYEFWGSDIAQAVCAAGEDEATPPAIVNLASVEYAKAVLPHLPAHASCTTCLFGEELRNGKPVQRSTASKTARGSMVRWMAENSIDKAADLKRFDVGYRLAPELCGHDKFGDVLVFMKHDAAERAGC